MIDPSVVASNEYGRATWIDFPNIIKQRWRDFPNSIKHRFLQGKRGCPFYHLSVVQHTWKLHKEQLAGQICVDCKPNSIVPYKNI
jgi:hypothetical protein